MFQIYRSSASSRKSVSTLARSASLRKSMRHRISLFQNNIHISSSLGRLSSEYVFLGTTFDYLTGFLLSKSFLS